MAAAPGGPSRRQPRVSQGRDVIIAGPSGSGKTTFLTLVGALRSVQHRTINIEGEDLGRLDARQLAQVRKRIGFIFQAHNLMNSLTACQNVQMAFVGGNGPMAAESRRMALDVLRDVGLSEHAHKLPRQLPADRNNTSRSPAPWPASRVSSWPTNLRQRWTGKPAPGGGHPPSHGAADRLHHPARDHDNRILDVADRIIRIEDGFMEETHLGMERMFSEIENLVSLLPPLLVPFSVRGGLPQGAVRHHQRPDLREKGHGVAARIDRAVGRWTVGDPARTL